MKKLLLTSTLLSVVVLGANAQTELKKQPSFTFNFFMNDFKGADYIRKNSINQAFRNKELTKFDYMTPGISVGYASGLTNKVDVLADLGGSFVKYPIPNKDLMTDASLLLDFTGKARLKLLSDKYLLNPYAEFGISASKVKGYFGAVAPVGAGVQIRLGEGTFANVGSNYRIAITEKTNYHFRHYLGIIKSMRNPAPVVVPPPPPPPVVDRDGDGVNDDVDRCPDTPGLASLNGCPDRDGDGIADMDDKCPDVAGVAKYQGCPIPDTDGDGINDEQDKCPTVAGVARYQGCPIPDTDGDGVNDEEDKCPSRPGPASNQGCPEIKKEVIEKVNYAAKNIFFATASSKLLAKSFKSLNEVANLMKADETLMLDIDGHTDSQGSDEYNQKLSEERADAVRQYLIGRGIGDTRLKSTGYGESKPVADNNTAAGRQKNRRTEMTVRNF
jgi:OmpA-OmpF porin, OOP family